MENCAKIMSEYARHFSCARQSENQISWCNVIQQIKKNPCLIHRLITHIDECASQPCMNHATCAEYIGFYNCSCVPGYNGTNCETGVVKPVILVGPFPTYTGADLAFAVEGRRPRWRAPISDTGAFQGYDRV